MKVHEILEGIKKVPKPRNPNWKAGRTRKAGAHYTEKGDFKRAREKEKTRKEVHDKE